MKLKKELAVCLCYNRLSVRRRERHVLWCVIAGVPGGQTASPLSDRLNREECGQSVHQPHQPAHCSSLRQHFWGGKITFLVTSFYLLTTHKIYLINKVNNTIYKPKTWPLPPSPLHIKPAPASPVGSFFDE